MTTRITTTCKRCNSNLSVSSDKSGKLLRCPQCHYPLKVPTASNEAETSADDTDDEKSFVEAGSQPQNVMIVVSPVESETEGSDMKIAQESHKRGHCALLDK